MKHRIWSHSKFGMPLKMEFHNKKELWYGMEFESIDFNAKIEADAFAFTFPANAIVIRYDLKAPGVTLERARELMVQGGTLLTLSGNLS